MKINLNERKIGYTYGSGSGSHTFRSKKRVGFESCVERDFLKIINFDSDAIDIVEQPMTIHYQNLNGRNVTYTPDYLVTFHNKKPWLVEIKTYDDLKKNWDEYHYRFKIGFKHAREEGYTFHIFHDVRIRTQRIDSIKFVEKYRHHTGDNQHTFQIKEYLRENKYATVKELIAGLFQNENAKDITTHIWHLVAIHVLFSDLNTPPSGNSYVWLSPSLAGLEHV